MEDPGGRTGYARGLLKPEALMPIVNYCVSVELEKLNYARSQEENGINKINGPLLSYVQNLQEHQVPEKLKELKEEMSQMKEYFKQRTESATKFEADLKARSDMITTLEQNLLARTEAVSIMQRDIAERTEALEKLQQSLDGRIGDLPKQTDFNVVDQLSVMKREEEKLRAEVFVAMGRNKEEVQNLITGVLNRLESYFSNPGNDPRNKQTSNGSAEAAQVTELGRQQKVLLEKVGKLEKEREESRLAQQGMKEKIKEQNGVIFEISQKLADNIVLADSMKCGNCPQLLADVNLLRANQEIMLSEQNTLKQTVSSLVARCDTEFQEQIPRADLQKMLKEHTEIMEIQEEMLDKQDSFNEKQNKFTKDQAELRKIQDTNKTHLELLSNQYKVMDSSSQKISTNLHKIEADLRSLEKNVQAIQLEQKALQDVQENILKEQRNLQTVQEKLLVEQKSVQDGMEKIKQANGQLFSSIQENQDVISDVQNTSKSQFEHLKQMTTKLQEKVTSDHDKFSADFLQAHEWCKQIEADQSRNAFQRNAERIKLSSTVDSLKVELENVLGKVSEVREEQEKIQDSVRRLHKSDWKRFRMAMETSTASESRALVYYSNDTELTNADTASFRSIQYNVDTTEALDENPPFDDSMAAATFTDESNDAEYRSVMNMFEDIDEERDSPETPDNEEPSTYNEPGQVAGKDNPESTGFFFEADFPRDVKPVLKKTLVRENLTKDGLSIVACHGTEPSEVCTVDIEDDILLTEQVSIKSSDVAQSKE